MASSAYRASLPLVFPPWLRRIVGTKLLTALGFILDEHVDRLVDGAKLRFPGLGDESALGNIGRDRKIRRGIVEPAETYARRLRLWLDSHRRRGGPYALLEQLHAFWLDDFNVRIDVVYESPTRRWIDEDGVITADELTSSTWNGDGGPWAQSFFVFFHLGDMSTAERVVTDEDGEPIVDELGDPITVPIVNAGVVSDVDAEMLKLVPREWSAAHIQFPTVILLYEVDGVAARCWDYPEPVPTWAEWEASGALWGGPVPITLIATE